MRNSVDLYTENDIEIRTNGILVKGTYFNKQEIADLINQSVFMSEFITKQSEMQNQTL